MRVVFFLILFLYALGSAGQADAPGMFTQTGVASYYAQKFQGRTCSCGEKFCHDSLTAAHKTLPFGTYVKVINLKNDSSVIVRINDRLPKKSKRVIDLTKRAAKQLDFLKAGVTRVRIEVVKDTLP